MIGGGGGGVSGGFGGGISDGLAGGVISGGFLSDGDTGECSSSVSYSGFITGGGFGGGSTVVSTPSNIYSTS